MVTADPDWLIHKPGKIRNGDNTSHSLIARVAAGLAPGSSCSREHDRWLSRPPRTDSRVRPVRSGDSLHELAALPVLRRNSAR